MAMFIGAATHSLDAKGRLVLPVRFRSEFEQGAVVAPYELGCLALWTPGEFTRQVQQRLTARAASAEQRRDTRAWAALSSEVEVDKQGRFLIPKSLRDRIQLDGDVLFNGNLDHVEIWNPTEFERTIAASVDTFSQAM